MQPTSLPPRHYAGLLSQLAAGPRLIAALEVIVKVLLLNGSGWNDETDFYRAFLKAVCAPEWHGLNLDALSDSVIAGSINGVEPPYRVKVEGASAWPASLSLFMEKVESIFAEARACGVDVELQVTAQ